MTDSARSGKIGDAYVPGPGASPLSVPGVRALLVTPRVTTRFEQSDGGKGNQVADVNEVLELIKGSTMNFEVLFQNENGGAANLSGATEASVVVKTDLNAVSNILLRREEDSNLTIDIPNSKLVCSLDQSAADALTPGTFIGQACVKLSGVWKQSKYFRVRILPSIAPQTP